MLKESINIDLDSLGMDNPSSRKLSIYHFNLFKPNPLGIYCMANSSFNSEFIAIVKKHLKPIRKIGPVSLIEIYRITPFNSPKLTYSIVENEELTAIAWCSSKHVVTTSKDQTINIYNVFRGIKIASNLTDYGSIHCMRYLESFSLLLTGTEFGYVGIYKLSSACEDEWNIESKSKMVKISGCIETLDLHMRLKDDIPLADDIDNSKSRKRKHGDDDDSDDEDESPNKDEVWLGDKDITVYGSSGPEIVAWNFHKTTIIDTMRIGLSEDSKVCSLLSLKNGDIAVGDSTGCLSIFDHNTFICRQSFKLFESDILCIAKDIREERIIAAGKDLSIVFLKKDNDKDDEFVLAEQIHFHAQPITCLKFITPKKFFSAALDGYLVKYTRDEGKKLIRHITIPSFHDKIKFSDHEMMFQYDRSIHVWNLPPVDYKILESRTPTDMSDIHPSITVSLKIKDYIICSTFNDKFIVYSTFNGLHIAERSGDEIIQYETDKSVPICTSLEFCLDHQFVIACCPSGVALVELDNRLPALEEGGPERCRVTDFQHFHTTSPKHIVYLGQLRLVAIGAAAPLNRVETFRFEKTKKGKMKLIRVHKIKLDPMQGISIMASSPQATQDDPHLFIYSFRDELIRLSLKEDAAASKECCHKLADLPPTSNLLGMTIMDQDSAIAWDHESIYRICLKSFRVVNQNSDYGMIIQLKNGLFNKCRNVALAELTEDDYKALLPTIKTAREKFGQ